MSAVQETIDWQGITLSVGYTPDKYIRGMNHLELQVLEPKGAKLPITETGYKSHFFYDNVDAYGGPIAYVRAWLDEAAGEPDWMQHVEDRRQFNLF